MHFSGKIIDVEITIFRLMCLRCLCVLSVTRCYAKVVHNLLTKIIPYYKWNCITSKNKILEHKLWFCCLLYGKICTTQAYDWILMRIICFVTYTKLRILASTYLSVFTNYCLWRIIKYHNNILTNIKQYLIIIEVEVRKYLFYILIVKRHNR